MGLKAWRRRRQASKQEADTAVITDRFLIVGLGNPGKKYRGNRHNIGFMTIDRLATAHHISLGQGKFKTVFGDGRVAGERVILAKPETFMNKSGDAIGPLADYFKIPPERILVVYDELDLPLGTLRLRPKGGAGGHNGMRSLIQHLGNEFPRLRLGIGRPPGRMPPAAYVLQDFGAEEKLVAAEVLDAATAAAETWLQDGIDLAMSRHNGSVIED